jgi:SAM-dependent methyltransferase
MQPAAYASAIPHYLSPDRRDPVKRYWEEPFSQAVLRSAVAGLPTASEAIRVLDIGAGTGDGFSLLSAALQRSDETGPLAPAVDYVGMDFDPDMVVTANDLHRQTPNVTFVQGDVLDGVPAEPFDLYMSAGVPYSHLSSDELAVALSGIAHNIKVHDRPAAVVVDVLGRYSLEWTANWDKQSWDYEMTFFQESTEAVGAEMTFHSRESLDSAIRTACGAGGLVVEHLDYYDRSIMVGRHTATRTFNKSIPAYRLLINRLYEGACEFDLDELLLGVIDDEAPAYVSTFFDAFREAWNGRIRSAQEQEYALGAPSPLSRRSLAEKLCALEYGLQPGFGSGHSLIGVAHLHAG